MPWRFSLGTCVGEQEISSGWLKGSIAVLCQEDPRAQSAALTVDQFFESVICEIMSRFLFWAPSKSLISLDNPPTSSTCYGFPSTINTYLVANQYNS